MKNKKHIAMRCNKEQFEAIKPNLEKAGYEFDIYDFKHHDYLCIHSVNEKLIANYSKSCLNEDRRIIHEQWNEKIFLKDCGIETIPTLEEVKEYFKDAETIRTLSNVLKISKDTFHLYEKDYWYTDENGYHGIVWNKEIGYAKILTYKTPKFEITKETVIKYQMKEEFPEVFEVKLPNDFTGWVLDEESPKIIAYSKKGFLKYGFNFYGKWIENTNTKIKHERKATPEEVTEALKKEAVSLGLVVGNYALFGEIKEARRISEEIIWNERHNCLCSGQNVLMNSSGKWATVIKTKTIQQAEELLKKLGHEIKIV